MKDSVIGFVPGLVASLPMLLHKLTCEAMMRAPTLGRADGRQRTGRRMGAGAGHIL